MNRIGRLTRINYLLKMFTIAVYYFYHYVHSSAALEVDSHSYKNVDTTKPAQDVDPALLQCWPTVADGGPTLNQHWINVSLLAM